MLLIFIINNNLFFLFQSTELSSVESQSSGIYIDLNGTLIGS